MRLYFLIACSLLATACPSSMEGQDVKSPEQIIAEEEQIALRQDAERKKNRSNVDVSGATEDERKRQWDEEYAQRELKRAGRSAESCPESVTEKAPKGKAQVTLVFGNDGHVKSSTVSAPYADTAMGACVLRAMGAIIVAAFTGEEHTVEWEIDLTGPKKTEKDDKKDDKKGKGKAKSGDE